MATPTANAAGLETVTSVFGGEGVTKKIPDDVFVALQQMMGSLGIPKEQGPMVKDEYVKLLNSPSWIARRQRGDNVWMPAVYSLSAHFQLDVFGPKAHPFVCYVLSTAGRPFEQKGDDKRPQTTYMVHLNVLARSVDPKVNFEGPAGLSIFGFPTQLEAQRVLDGIRAGRYYRFRLNVHQQSPVGELKMGQIGRLSGNSNAPIEPIEQPDGYGWADPYARAASCYPLSSIRELLACRESYLEFRLHLTVQRGNVTSKATGTSAVLTCVDPSIIFDRPTLDALGGGISVWLPKDSYALARLPTGSEVDAVVSVGKEVDVKDRATGNPTGDKRRLYNAVWLRTTFDAGEGGGQGVMPNPNEVAATLPSKPTSRDL